MKPPKRDIHLGMGDGTFPEGTHMCLIYSDEAERRESIGRYLALGLADRESVSYFADTTSEEEIQSWLDMISREASSGVTAADIKVHSAESVYCPNGRFDPDEMLERLGGCYQTAVASGRAGARVSGEMTWALKGIPGSHRLIEYEAKINLHVEKFPTTAVCQYDARRFDGATLLEVLRVHPMMIVRGQIVRNPYYLRPEEFFRERNRSRIGHGA
ncbi:MAG: MEDS domain-containing protein [Verrucomicrobiales bacterium]|nr:MEDS domain-containing protein [Verrucomicrobiales bacterium]